MKYFFTTALFIALSFSFCRAQFVTIPDAGFVSWLKNNGFASCMNGNLMDTTCSAIVNATSLNISGDNITNLEGLEYFDNLQSLTIAENLSGGNIPRIPSGVTYIYAIGCGLTNIQFLSQLGLTYLEISNNNISDISNLPPTLTALDISKDTLLTTLPANFPTGLTGFECDGDRLTNLTNFNEPDLINLSIDNNPLKTLPNLPATLQTLNCSGFSLTSVPSLPSTLTQLDCSINPLLSCLPTLPSGITSLNISGTAITCVPNKPAGVSAYLSSYPLCTSVGISIAAYPSNIICQGTTSVLVASNGYNSYTWSTGATTQSISVLTQNVYYVTVTNACSNILSGSMNVMVKNIPAAPTALAGSGATNTQVTANWSPVNGANTYFIDVSLNNTFSSFLAGYNNLNVGNFNSLNVTGLTAGTTYYYRVRANNVCGSGSNSNTIQYATTSGVSNPSIISFTPANGPVGTLVTITGTHLDNPTAFTIGGANAIVISNSDTTLVGMVMPGAVTGPVSVTTAGGTANGAGNFTVTPTPYPGQQQGSKLVGTGAVGNQVYQGLSVSISADGNTAIVGGVNDNSGAGAAWVYTRSGGVWNQQGNKLVGTGATGSAEQGWSVSLSADGNTAIVGGDNDNSGMGAAWVYTRSGGVWKQQGNKLVGTGAIGGPFGVYQGFSVSLSADGNTAIVGGYNDNSMAGAAWVYTRSGGVWTQQGNKLVGTGATGAANQGISVSLSADGNTAIVGGYNDNSGAGAVWVYTCSGGVWTQQGSKLIGTGAIGIDGALQGASVSLSADGNTAIVGGTDDNGGAGAAWVYIRSGGVWMQQGSKLVGTGAVGSAAQGSSVSLSADGNTAIVGGVDDNSGGATWVYTRLGGVWTQQGSKLVGTGAVGDALQGRSVSLSADGNTAIVGGRFDNSNSGAAWVFIPCGNVLVPLVSIAANPAGAICSGTNVQFMAMSTNEGATPSYQWKLNNVNVGSNSATYSNSSLSNNDSIEVVMTSSANCVSPTSANSNSVKMSVNSILSALVSTAGTVVSQNQFTANWNTVSGATTYYLDVSTNNTFSNFVTGYNNLNVGKVTTYNVTGLTSATAYYYRVRANNACGTGSSSNTIGVTTTTCSPLAAGTVSPASTIICSGNTTVLTLNGASGGTLQWEMSLDNINWITIAGATNTTYTTSSGNGTTLKYYRCMGTNACYNASSTTSVVDISSPIITVTASGITDQDVTLNWSPVGSGNYTVSWSGAGTGSVANTTPPKTITGLTPGGTYSITVTQTGVLGCAASGVVSPVTTLCSSPANLTATAPFNNQVNVSWTGSAGSYRIFYRPLFSSSTYYAKDVIGATSATITRMGSIALPPVTTYEIYVAALNCPTVGAIGAPSAKIYVTTPPALVCAAPVIDSVKSICPVQVQVWMHPGSSPTGVYQVYFQCLTPAVQGVVSYSVNGNYITVNLGSPGQTYLVAVASNCGGGSYSNLVIWPGGLTLKPLCSTISNLTLSNSTCKGFTASWNTDQCLSNSVSYYQIYLRQQGTINWISYPVQPPAPPAEPFKIINVLAKGSTYQVYVRSIYSCNGFNTAGPASQILTDTTKSISCREEDEQANGDNQQLTTQQYSQDKSEVMSLYPNPNNGEFMLDISSSDNSEKTVRAEVMNMLGQTIMTKLTTISDGHLNQFIRLPETTASGYYFVRVTVGNNVYVTKINISRL